MIAALARLRDAPSIALAIATTGGPAVVRAISYDPDAARSQMVWFDQNHIPMAVNEHVDGFDRALRRQLARLGVATPPHPAIIELDAGVDAGMSWQLGLAAAHVLHGARRLALGDIAAAPRLLATGRLGTSAWDAQSVAGIAAKLEAAGGFLAAGQPAVFLLPAVDAAAAPAVEGVLIAGVAGLADLLALSRRQPPQPPPPPPRARGARLAARLALVAAAGALAVAGPGGSRIEPPAPAAPAPPVAAAREPPGIVALHPRAGLDCATAMAQGDAGVVATVVEAAAPAVGGDFHSPLCALDIDGRGAAVDVALTPPARWARLAAPADRTSARLDLADAPGRVSVSVAIRTDGAVRRLSVTPSAAPK